MDRGPGHPIAWGMLDDPMSDDRHPFWEEVDGRRPLPPASRHLGLRFLEANPGSGTIRVAFSPRPEFANPRGQIQGGFLSAMLDDAIGAAVATTLAPDEFAVTLEIKVSYLRPAELDEPDDTSLGDPMPDPEPHATRPSPGDYFLAADQGTGLLPYRYAIERLERDRNYWLATSGTDSTPHCMPVWGIWTDGRFVFSTGPRTKKARNLNANPKAVLHLESGAEVVVVECRAREVSDPDALEAFRVVYNAKYQWDFTPEQLSGGGVYELRPTKAFAWRGDHGEQFSGTATRWTFPEPRE